MGLIAVYSKKEKNSPIDILNVYLYSNQSLDINGSNFIHGKLGTFLKANFNYIIL